MEKKRLQQGVFDELFELYYDKLSVFVYSYINDAEAARDIVNDLFLNLWKDRTHLNPERSVKSYLYTIARNRALDYLKHRRVVEKNIRNIIDEYENSGTDWQEIEQQIELVRRKLDQLSGKQREVIVKCCVEGKMYKEVALELNISENTVKTHLTRALKFMREELRDNFILLFTFRTRFKTLS